MPPLPPTNVEVSRVSTRSARLSWQPPTVTFLNSLTSVSSYRVVARQTSFNISDLVVELPSTQTAYSFPSTLEEFTVYMCEVHASNSFGYGAPSQPVTLKTQEAVPSSFPRVSAAVAKSSTVLSLHWLPPPSVHINGRLQYYLVNMTETDTGKKWSFHTVGGVLRLGSLHPHYRYSYAISARTIGNGPYSPLESVMTLEDAPVGPPQYVTVASKSSTSLTLGWQPPQPSQQNGDIRFYTITLQEQETNQSSEFTANSTEITLQSLHPHYHYEAKVRAETILPGPYSEKTNTQLDEDAPSVSPVNVSGNASSSTSLHLEWSAPPPDTHNGVIRSYTILLYEEDTGLTLTYKALNTSKTIASLHPYYVYHCQVQAFTVSNGPPSEPVLITTLPDVPSGAPRNVSVAERNSSSLILTWLDPSPELQNGVVTLYSGVLMEVLGLGLELVANVTSTEEEVEFSELTPHTNYIFQVAAHNSEGRGPLSATFYTHTAEDAPADSPSDLRVLEVMSDHVVLDWEPPHSDLHNGVIREYLVEVSLEGDGPGVIYRATNPPALIDGLHPDYSYTVSVAAHTVKTGPYSPPLQLHTLEDVPSHAPVELMPSNLLPTSATLLWSPPPEEHQNGDIVNYLVEFISLGAHNGSAFFTNSTSLDVAMLRPFTSYSFSVSAATAVGFGPASQHYTFKTAEEVPLLAPTNLTGSAIASHSASLSWTPPPEDSLNGILRHYQVDIIEEATSRQFSVLSSSNQTILSSLHPFYSYVISVAAVTVGAGPFSVNITIVTHEDVPSSSPQLGELSATSRSLSLSWRTLPPEDLNGVITGYTVTITDLDDLSHNMESYFTESHNHSISRLAPYTTYGLTLTAHTQVGSGPTSSLHTIQTQEEAPIGRPTNLTTVRFDSTSIHLYWDHPPEDTHYGFIREYRLNVTELESGGRWREVVDSEETEAILSGLHPFYTYYITIIPVTVEEGDNYTHITIRTAEDAPSAPPSNLVISNLESRSFHLRWDPPPTDRANGIIRRYLVNLTEERSGRERILESFSTSLEVNDVHPHTTYLVSVSAFTVSNGPALLEVVNTLEDVPTAPPVNLSLVALTPRTLLVTWQPPPLSEQNGVITYYIIILEDENKIPIRAEITSDLHLTLEGLTPFQSYSVRISASTVIGIGPHTIPSLEIEMPEAGPTYPPPTFEVLDITTHNFTLEWATPPPPHNGIIRGYLLNITELDTGRVFTRETTELSLVVGHLHPFYTYMFTIAGVTVTAGSPTEPTSILTLEATPSSAPADLVALHVTSTSLSLSWGPPPPQHHNGIITHYLLTITDISTLTATPHLTNSTELSLTGLQPYSGYEVRVAAFTAQGRGPSSDIAIFQTEQDAPSAPPVNLSVGEILSHSVSLSWASPDQELLNGELTHYVLHIFEEDTNSTREVISAVESTVLVFLHPFYTYVLHVAAVTVLPGPYSSSIVVTTLEDAPSSPPVNIEAVANSPTSVAISWDPPPLQARNGLLRQYSLLITAETPWLQFTEELVVNGTSTELNATGLAAFVTYHIQINAHTISPGPLSTALPVTTFETAPSSPPCNLSLSILSPSAIELTWLPPQEEARNGIIRHYRIRLWEAVSTDTPLSLLKEVHEESFPAIFSGLHPFYHYELRISAVTVSLGPFSDPISWTMPEDAPSSPPLNVSVSGITSREFSLQWLPPATQDHNGILQNYSISLRDETMGAVTLYTVDTNRTSMTFPNLHPAYIYSVAIAAVTVSQGPLSDAITVIMKEDIPSSPPADVKERVVNSTMAQLSWLPPPQHERNGEIISYNVVLSANESGDHLTHYNITATSNLIDLLLRPFSEYNVSIAAATAVGLGPFTAPRVFHTPEDVPSHAPTILSIDLITATSFIVKWKMPRKNETNGFVRHFMLKITESHSSTLLSEFRVYGVTKRVDDLHPYYIYDVRIATVTTAIGPYSPVSIVQTREAAPSAPPTEINILDLESRHINISWQPPPVEHQNGVIRQYQLTLRLHSTINSMQDQAFFTALTTLVINDLFPYHNYSFTLSALTLSPGPESDSLEFLTPEDAPNVAPPLFTANEVGSREFRLSWTTPAATDINGILRNYLLIVLSNDLLLQEVEIEATHNQSEFVVDSLTPYSLYNCTVAAVTVERGPTAMLQVRTAEEAPAHSPEDVVVGVLDAHTLNVSWLPPSSQQNGVIRSYYVNLTQANTQQDYQHVTNNTFIIISNLLPYTAYFIRVTAVTVLPGPFSETAYAATPEAAPYSHPQNLSGVAVGPTSIVLHWLPPPSHLINGILRYYHIHISDPSGRAVHNHLLDGDSLEASVNQLHPYFLYNCSVAAVTVDDGPISSLQILTPEDVPSGSPSNLHPTSTNTSITLTWEPLPLEQRKGVILKYWVTLYGVITNTTDQLETNETSIEIPNLHPFYQYQLSVTAENSAGVGPISQPVLYQLPEARPSESLQNLSVSILSPSSVQLSWILPPRESWNGVITNYTVITHSLGPNNMSSAMDDIESQLTNSTSSERIFSIKDNRWSNNPDPRFYFREVATEEIIVENLNEYFTYCFSMYMSNSAGNSNRVESSTVQLPGTAPTGYPLEISVEAISSTSIGISWKPPPIYEWNGVITSYRAVLQTSTSTYYDFEPNECWTDCVIEDLDPNTKYYVSLAALSEYGTGPFSEEVQVQTLEDVPSTPVNVSAHVLSQTEVLLSWNSPIHTNGIITHYQITYSSTPATMTHNEITSSQTIVLSNLTLSQYTLKVQAATSAGFGAYSKEIKVQMIKGPQSEGLSGSGHESIGWVLFGLALIVVLAILLVLAWMCKKYKKTVPHRIFNFSEWTANPLYQDSASVEERIINDY